MKKVILLLILLLVWFFIRFVLGGNEDSWICVDGQWVKHGQPSASIPTGECKK